MDTDSPHDYYDGPPICRRCGQRYWECNHLNTQQYGISDAHAARIAARYTFGERFNPDHDLADYYTDPLDAAADAVPQNSDGMVAGTGCTKDAVVTRG